MSRRLLVLLALVTCLVAARAEDSPLARSKVGEWVLQKQVITGGGAALTLGTYMWVSKVDGRKVTIMTQPLGADLKTPSDAAQTSKPIDLDKLAADANAKKLGEEEVEAKGTKLKCTKSETTNDTPQGKLTTTTWTSSDVPVYGIVRQIVKDKDGKEVLHTDLADWGADGAKEKPFKK